LLGQLQKINEELTREMRKMEDCLREKELKIANLEKISIHISMQIKEPSSITSS
jgi:hypothetical protein